jgi:hypothetical protein
MSLRQLKNYGDVKDSFSYVLIDSPEFKMRSGILKRQVTIDEVFDQLVEGIRNVRSRIKRLEALQLLDRCAAELDATRRLFIEGRIHEARLKLQDDEQLFVHGYRERRAPKDRIPRPANLSEDEDENVGDPEFDVP